MVCIVSTLRMNSFSIVIILSSFIKKRLGLVNLYCINDVYFRPTECEKTKQAPPGLVTLAAQDMKKVCHLALIELTALYDVLGIELKQQKAVKIKTKGNFETKPVEFTPELVRMSLAF